MYEKHFGLNKRPFPARAEGAAVFVGPQTARTMSGLKKGLMSQDAVIAVSGPAGSGKTTLVTRSMDALSGSHKTVHIGRMQLEGTDALEFLLEELGVTDPPRGPIRQIQALRTQLSQLESQGTRVVVIIEDAIRSGAEALSEIESLTAADAGASSGAAIVLMGDDGLAAFCKDPQLARLEQRIRQRLTISAFSAPELRGYLMHCFRLAGSDFEFVFDDRAAELIHQLSGGIPRIANNIVEAALSAAAMTGSQKITAGQVVDIAKDEFGLEADDFEVAPVRVEPAHLPEPEPEPIAEAPIAEAPIAVARIAEEPIAEAPIAVAPIVVAPIVDNPDSEEPIAAQDEAETLPEPVVVFSDEPIEEPPSDSDSIPELIQDTLPDLAILAPEIVAMDEAPEPEVVIPELQPEPVLELESESESEPLPVLDAEPEPAGLEPELLDGPEFEAVLGSLPENEMASESEPEPEPKPEPVSELELELAHVAESAADEIPAWDRDPTLSELRPDLDALEKAMAFAHGEPEDASGMESPADEAAEQALAIDEIPEITLDHAIQERIESCKSENPDKLDIDAPESPPAGDKKMDTSAVEITQQAETKADADLEKIAAELAKAKTIEDVDDRLAETLFGEEISLIAAQVIAGETPAESANDEEQKVFNTAASATVAQSAGSAHAEPFAPTEPPVEVSLETRKPVGESGMDLSASQRLKTVRALNAELDPSLREPEDIPPVNGTGSSATNEVQPEPIEDQINTSITQTLKALKVKSPTVYHESDDEDTEKKSGFFSRFKRS